MLKTMSPYKPSSYKWVTHNPPPRSKFITPLQKSSTKAHSSRKYQIHRHALLMDPRLRNPGPVWHFLAPRKRQPWWLSNQAPFPGSSPPNSFKFSWQRTVNQQSTTVSSARVYWVPWKYVHAHTHKTRSHKKNTSPKFSILLLRTLKLIALSSLS